MSRVCGVVLIMNSLFVFDIMSKQQLNNKTFSGYINQLGH